MVPIVPYVLAHSLLPHFSRFGPRLARFWGRGPFLDPPVLRDSACPSTSELLEPSINDYRSITIGTIYSQVVSVDCRPVRLRTSDRLRSGLRSDFGPTSVRLR